MAQFTVEELKNHLVVVDDTGADDAEILQSAQAAEDWITRYVRRDLDSEFPEGWPAACKQCIKMLVLLWYDNRLSGQQTDPADTHNAVRRYLADFRSFAGE